MSFNIERKGSSWRGKKYAASFLALLMFVSLVVTKVENSTLFRSRLQEEDEVEQQASSLRFLTFGSSRTWGAGIEDREHKSFAGLLHATNKGICGSTPDYPAMCLYSMIGEEAIFDVIILEYLQTDQDSGSLGDLGKRLRVRFPNAVIIFLNYWAPREYTYTPEGGKSLQEYHKEHMNPKLGNVFQGDVFDGTKPEDWLLTPYSDTIVQQHADNCNGFVLNLPVLDNPIETLKKYGDIYLTDMTHFSEKGHAFIYDEITNYLNSINFDGSQTVVGEWDSQDHCAMWYDTGKLPQDGDDFKTNMNMVPFSLDVSHPEMQYGSQVGKIDQDGLGFGLDTDTGDDMKYALEVKSDTPGGEDSTIQLNNPWEREATLYLSYMATGPVADYPNVLAKVLHGDDRHQTAGLMINPKVPGYTNPSKLHIVMHWKVGPVESGESTLSLHAFKNASKPFPNMRIVGFMLTPHHYPGMRVAADF